MSKLTRRGFLAASATFAASAAFGKVPLGIRKAIATPPAGNSLSAVKHVVILMQENRSFDHYFGTLRGVRGFDDPTALLLRNGNSVFQQPNASGSSDFTLPFHLDSSMTSAQCVRDLDHSWTGTHDAWNHAKYDSWVIAKSAYTMGYFEREDIPVHYALADAFTLCDNYYCSVMGPTFPNRLYLFTGMIDPNGTGGGPVLSNTTGFSWTTYAERLQAANVSWKVYQDAQDYTNTNALTWFKQFQSAVPGTPLYEQGMTAVPQVTGTSLGDIVAAIESDVKNGTLPQVSWIAPPVNCTEHPNVAPAAGAELIAGIFGALTSNPDVWASTVFLVMYDENDGFFDHVQPPTPPSGTADEFVDGLPIGLGPRVPMFVMSPWSRGGYVCSEVFDHTSVIRFLETWTGVAEPNISSWRRQLCGDLTSAFDFDSRMISVPLLPNASALAQQAAQECSALPAPVPPATGTMPEQEKGRRPARPLPYQPNAICSVDRPDGILWVTMDNDGTQSVHYSIYLNNYRTDGPVQYDIAGNGGSLKTYFHVQAYGGGDYDLSVYGPNGFLRRFVGDINTVGGQLEVTSSYDLSKPGNAKLLLTFTNNSDAPATFTVTPNDFQDDGPWTYELDPGATIIDYWHVERFTRNWYDLTVTVDVDTLFQRRFAGHLETGRESVSGC
jgi:phospholipase C